MNALPVTRIHADLTATDAAGGLDMTGAKKLKENAGIAFIGTQKNGAFDIPGDLARAWLLLPTNPNGRPNSDVLRPWANGMDVTRRPSDTWIIDFGVDMPQREAMLYEAPFQHVLEKVKPLRDTVRREGHRKYWWIHGESRRGLRAAVAPLSRFIATSMVAKHRFFVWLPKIQIPENLCVVIAREDDATFGILHSRFHELWSLRMCTYLGVGNDPRYTPSTTFETFPFPSGDTAAIGEAAKRLCELRDHWLNPPDLVVRVPEVVAGYPDRILPVNDAAAAMLKTRTLTNLYNQRPAWLAEAHRALDEAVASAYGWPADLPDEDLLRRLLELNKERSNV